MIEMFWKVIESFSIEDRMQFIRFSSGNLGLPAPGLKWEDNISVIILSRERKEKSQEIIDLMRKLGFKESQIRIKEREIDFSVRQIQNIVSNHTSKLDLKEMENVYHILFRLMKLTLQNMEIFQLVMTKLIIHQ